MRPRHGALQPCVGDADVAGDHRPAHILPDATERLAEFNGLIALMLANADARTRLEQLATSDPLTGLTNHRATTSSRSCSPA